MWKDRAIVGRAVGIRTVSSATRKMDKQRATNAKIVGIDGFSRCSGVVPTDTVAGIDSNASDVGFVPRIALLDLGVMFVADSILGTVDTEPVL